MAVQLTEAAKNKLHALGILPYDSDKAKTTYMLPQNEEGWAYERKIRCTASDIGMVAGQSDRGDAAVALHRKFNPLPPSPAMAVALRLEPIIANNYVNQLKVRSVQFFCLFFGYAYRPLLRQFIRIFH